MARLASYFSGGFGLAVSAQATLLIPLRARDLGAGFDAIGLIAGVGALAPALLAVVLGVVVDRLGPKRSFIVGAAATAGSSTLFVLVTNYWWFLALQPILGLSQTFGWVASQSYITSLGTVEDRPQLTGRFGFFVNVGQMAGPLLAGAAIQLVGVRGAFLLPALYSALFAIVGMLLLDTGNVGPPAPRAARGAAGRAFLELLKVPGIQFALVLTFTRLWIGRVFGIFAPVYLLDAGIKPGLIGTVVATSGLMAAAVAPTTGWWTRRLPQQTVAATGMACGAVGLVLLPHLHAIPSVYVVPALVGIGSGLSLPILLSIVTTSAPPERRGMALGMRTTGNQAASTAAPVIVGPMITSLGTGVGIHPGRSHCRSHLGRFQAPLQSRTNSARSGVKVG